MTILEAYTRFLELVNRNATNNNISVDKPRFVQGFNSMSIQYVEWVLNKRNEDEVRNLRLLLNTEHPLTFVSTEDNYSRFSLPKDYFDLSNVHVYGSKGKCKNQRFQTYEFKTENLEEIFHDSSNEPSFDFRETFYTVSKNDVVVYKKGFDISQVNLTYYRYPKKVDIAGYINLEEKASKNVDPEFDDKVTLKILLAMSKTFSANNGDANQYQIDKDRLFSNI
jgi:hypothetical protein